MKNLVRNRANPMTLFEDMRDSFQSFFYEFPSLTESHPAIDVHEDTDKFVIEAEVPGYKPNEINVDLNDDVLTISSRKEEKREEEDEGYLLKERKTRAFKRAFRIPSDVKRDKIEAGFEDGVLTIQLPRSERKNAKRIEIASSRQQS